MKFLTFLFLIFTSTIYSQEATYTTISKKGTFKKYTTKDNYTIKIGDTLLIGVPYQGDTFAFITQGNSPTISALSGTKAVVTKLKSWGNKRRGYKMFAQFKGWGLLPVNIDIEGAISAKEIIIKTENE